MSARDFDPGPLAEVEGQRAGDRWTLVFIRELAHPPTAVWAALTEPAQLQAWSPFTADRDLGTTGDAILTMIDGDSREDLPGVVRTADAPHVLEYTWGDDLLRWELTATDAGTRLVLRHTVDEQDWLARAAAGWHLCLLVAERLLDGDPIEPVRGEEAKRYGWEELHKAYAERLGGG